jgi:hypothetical protein
MAYLTSYKESDLHINIKRFSRGIFLAMDVFSAEDMRFSPSVDHFPSPQLGAISMLSTDRELVSNLFFHTNLIRY